jgi:hypothetical protein
MRFVPLSEIEAQEQTLQFVPLQAEPTPAAEPVVSPEELAAPPGGFVTPGGAVMVPPRMGRRPPSEDATAAAFRDTSRQRDIPPAAPAAAAPTGPELRPWEPTLWERFLNLSPGDRAKAANEALARRIAKEKNIPVAEAYRQMREAVGVRGIMGTRPSGQPMFNPEGRAPIKAVTEATPYVVEGILDFPKGMAEAALRAYRAGDIESSVDTGYVDRAITYLGDDAKDIFIPNLPERMGLRREDPNYQGFMGQGQNLGYSLTTMVASAITGTGAAIVTGNPVVGVGAGMATSGTLSYRASKDEFLDRLRTKLNNDSKKVFNRPLSNAEWDKAKKEFNAAAVEYAAWEAIPEAISNAIFLKAFAAPVRGASGSRLAGYIKKASSFAAENLTETATGMGQNAAELKAGLTEDEITVADAFKQQFIQTAITMGVMGGGMKGKDLAVKFYNEQVLPKVDPASALAKAIKADIDAVAFSPQAIKQEADYLLRTGAKPRTLAELARQRPVAPVPPGGAPAGEEPPDEPAAPPAAAGRVEPKMGEPTVGPEAGGRVEPRVGFEALPPAQGAEPTLTFVPLADAEGRVEPTLGISPKEEALAGQIFELETRQAELLSADGNPPSAGSPDRKQYDDLQKQIADARAELFSLQTGSPMTRLPELAEPRAPRAPGAREVPTIPGMPTGEELAEPPAAVTPVTQAEAAAPSTPVAPDQTLSVSGKDKRGDSWAAQYEPMILGDGSIALVRTLTYADGDQSVSHFGMDGTWQKGRPSAVRLKGATQTSGAESFPDVESAMRAAQDDASGMGGQIPAVTPVIPATAVVQPTPAAAALPETPTVPPATKPKTFEPPPPNLEPKGLALVEVPLDQLSLSKDVPQFKIGASAKGVVEPLGGKFERTGVAPIQVWRRLDGSLEVISGRHRFDLAQRSGETTIPAQIHDEAKGFTRDHAAVLDAELNIRDGQGKAKDYVNYFKESGIDRQTAESRGLLARATGKRSFTIATQGSDELITAVRSDQIGDEAAYYVALNAPKDSRLQAVGINAINDGKSMNTAINMMQAVKALAGEQDTTTDMFGFDDSAMREAEEMAKIAARKQREIQTRLSAISGAAKNPAVARAEGIDIKDPEAVKRRIDELRQRKATWDNWSTSPELIAEIRSERGVAPPMLTPVEQPTEPLLTTQTPEELRERAEREAAEAKRKTQAEQEIERRAKADQERDEFVLTGSDRAADEVAARGQEDLFAAPPAAAPAPAVDRNVIGVMPNGETRLYREQDGISPDDLVQWKYSPNAPAKVGRVERVQDAFTGKGGFAAQIRDQQGGIHLVDTKRLTKVGTAPKIRDVVNNKQPSPTLPAENRLVLMPCCDMKGPEKAPAMELYKGVFFQTFKGNVKDGARPNVVILSAKHGFISPTEEIEPYDQVMDKARADEMLINIRAQLKGVDFPRDIKDVLIVGGKEYQRVMRAAVIVLQDEGVISIDASVNATSGGIGDQRKQLGEYLRSIEAKQPARKEAPKAVEPGALPDENDPGFRGASDPYTEEQRAEAQTHANEVGGEIVWQQGDYALIRGYSVLSGDPVYVPTMGSNRARVDIESFTGKQIPDGVRQEMISAKQYAERVAAIEHKKDPFIVFDKGVAISSDIPQDLAGVIREWKDLLKLNVPIFVGTIDFAKENKNNFTGPHRRIGSGTLDANERGSMRRMSDGSYYILFKPSTSRTLMLETIAHEMGHVHERLVFEKATPEEKKALQEAHLKWVESQKGKTAKELVEALRGRSVGRAGRAPEGMKAEDMTSYWRSFGEWYADQVSRWAVSAARPVSIVEKYFKRLAIQLRRFYQQLQARKYLPDETFVKYIEAVTSREANLEPAPDASDKSSKIVELPKKEVTGTLDVDGVQRPLANSNGQRIHPTEEGTRNFWRWFGDSQVVDAQGRPLVVYHGTGFTQAGDAIVSFHMSAGLYGAGAYFSGNPERAASYAKAGQGTVYPVYVRLVNPISVDDYIERFEGTTRSDERAWDARQELLNDGVDGVLSEPRGPTRFWEVVAFNENQIKSAIGNLGTFNPDSPSIIQSIEPASIGMAEEPYSDQDVLDSEQLRKERIKEYATLRAQLARVPKEVAAGRAGLEMQETVTRLLDRARNLQFAIKATKPRRDSAEQFLAKALNEYDAGNISPEVLEVIDAAYRKFPDLLEGLLLRVRAAPKTGRAAGDFVPWERIIRLYKGTSGVREPATIRHELTHTLEQMMTPEQRMAVVQAWGKALSRAIKQNPDELNQKYFNAVLDFLDNPTDANYRKAQAALPSYEMYQFINPSEFWAVNAEKLMAAQLGGAWDKFKRAVRRMWEGVKKVLGFDNRYDIHKVFNQVMGGSRERLGQDMLVDMVSATGGKFVTLENIEDEKKLVEKYNRPKTPMLDTTPVKTFITRQFKNGKEFFQDAAENPREAMVGAGDSVMDGLIYLRNKNVWYGSGLEARDFDQYNGELRTSEGIATASVALDNAIRSGNIGVEVIFRGGIEYDTNSNNFVAVKRRLGMKGVYEAESALKKKLGDQLGTDIIQGYLEAKRSISIMDELYDREAAFEAAKDTLKMLRESGADPEDIAQAKAVAEALATDVDNIKKAVSSVNMSEDEMYEFAALDQKHPELRQIMDNWNAVNQNLLKFWRQVGLISQGRYEKLAAIKDYVPWFRIMADEEDVHSPLQSTTRALTNIGREKLFKRGKPIAVVDFRATAGQKDFKIQPSSVVKVEVNGKPVSDDLVSVAPDGQVRLDMDLEENDLVVFKTNREIENIIDNMTRNVMRMTMNGIRQFAANRIVMEYGSRNANGKIMTFPSVDKEKGRFNWVVNGKKVVVEIQDPLVAASIYGMENLNLQMWKPLAMVANLTRRSITLSGVFQIKQVFKDAPTAALVTGVKNPLALIGGVWKGFLTSLTETDPVVDILKAAGIGGFHSPARTPEAKIKLSLGIMNRNVFSALIKGLDHIGDSSDMAQRVAIYKRVLAETGDETQALFQAANVINFLHHGSAGYAQAAVKVVPFLGAYANSTDVLVRALVGGGLKGMSRKKAFARLGITIPMLVSLSILYSMLAGGDPEYDELDDQTKLKNIIIPGTKIMLPMNTSAAYFFKALPELIYNVVTREGTENEMDRRRIRNALADAARDMLLGPEPIPAGVKPVLEVVIKHDFFTGRTVIPKGLEGVEAAEQYTGTTSELGKKLSAMLVIPFTDGKRVLSPIEADHIIRGVFGTAGAMAQWIINSIGTIAETRPEPSARETPIIGSFLRDEVPRGREDLFYDFKDVVFEKYKTWKKMIDREDFDAADAYLAKHGDVAAMYEYINETEAELKDINAEIRRLGETRSKDQTPKERREQIDEFKRLRNEILDPVKELRREVLQ